MRVKQPSGMTSGWVAGTFGDNLLLKMFLFVLVGPPPGVLLDLGALTPSQLALRLNIVFNDLIPPQSVCTVLHIKIPPDLIFFMLL